MSATLVELHDGRVVVSDAEAWRMETLARHVMNLATWEAETEWLADFHRRHGPTETDRLRDQIDSMRPAQKGSSAG